MKQKVKNIIAAIVGILLIFLFFKFFQPIMTAVTWYQEIDNTDYGFPLWLDIIIDALVGGLAFSITGFAFNKAGLHNGHAMALSNKAISITLGIVLPFVIHALLKYWLWILGVILIVVLSIGIYHIISFKKRDK